VLVESDSTSASVESDSTVVEPGSNPVTLPNRAISLGQRCNAAPLLSAARINRQRCRLIASAVAAAYHFQLDPISNRRSLRERNSYAHACFDLRSDQGDGFRRAGAALALNEIRAKANTGHLRKYEDAMRFPLAGKFR
jgi:hypothetical protein